MPSLFTPAERDFAAALSDLVYTNPFTPDRIELERRALGDDFREDASAWSLSPQRVAERPNLMALRERSRALVEAARERLASGDGASRDELVLYEDLALYVLYEGSRDALHDAAERAVAGRTSAGVTRDLAEAWRRFDAGFTRAFRIPRVKLPTGHRAEHVFASFFQVRRAFSHIFHYLVGASQPAARLRAAVWQSIFTHDFRAYYAALYSRMADYTTLITGPSGTGKELVARAIGRSRYIPFDPQKERFAADFAASFFAVNLSALSPTLIESELFGHQRGAFTGAVADRAGWLESCPALGTVFLDEIGELDPVIQVKLLRVLQSRAFSRLGETAERRFEGKIIAATNRDLATQMDDGTFRTDFYYRLCSDVITTPSLAAQLADRPDDLRELALHITQRLAPEIADGLADRVADWISKHLGAAYVWPGNFRELEQCVRNLVIRGSYAPVTRPAAETPGPLEALASAVCHGELTADELLARYIAVVYRNAGSYHAAAARLGLDRRTCRAKIDADFLSRLSSP